MKIKNKNQIALFLVIIGFVMLAWACGEKSNNSNGNTNHTMKNLSIQGNSASFSYEVGFMYTLAYCGLAKDIWHVLHKNPQVNHLQVKVEEECEDQFGNKNRKETILSIDQEWINTVGVRKFVDEDKFCNYAHQNHVFIDEWVPIGNYCK